MRDYIIQEQKRPFLIIDRTSVCHGLSKDTIAEIKLEDDEDYFSNRRGGRK